MTLQKYLWSTLVGIRVFLLGAMIAYAYKEAVQFSWAKADEILPTRAAPGKVGDYNYTIQVNGLERQYLIHVPASYVETHPIPVVLNFHGGGVKLEWHIRLIGMNATADAHGFLVVYPQGITGPFGLGTWNAGSCCGIAMWKNVDDVKFTAALIDDLASRYAIDRRRIFATGMSNGAMLVYRLACELSDRIAAIASIAGTLKVDTCKLHRPVPVLHFHGTADESVPYKGGYGKIRTSGEFRSVAETVQMFIQLNGCRKDPEKLYEKGDVTCYSFLSCRDNATVTLCTIEGGGHTWPGVQCIPKYGKTTYDISANEAMWKFFEAHPMP
jgi:polyhydroxybutyrate depolymerase